MTIPTDERRLDAIAARIVNEHWEQAWKLAHARTIETMAAELRAEQEATKSD